jgi:hypothetical protein
LLSLTTGSGGITQYDNAIKPLEFDYFYSQAHCDSIGIDYTSPKVLNTIVSVNNPSWQDSVDYWYIDSKIGTYFNPYIYKNGVVIAENVNYLLPRSLYWTIDDIWRFYPTITATDNSKNEMTNNWNACNIAYFNSQFYLSIYDLIYILDVNYDVVSVKKAILPIKYFFTDGTSLWFATTNRMVCRCK